MQEILRTNNPVLISYARSVLIDAGIESVDAGIESVDAVIESVELYAHIANLEGGVSTIPRRVMVVDAEFDRARLILAESKLDV